MEQIVFVRLEVVYLSRGSVCFHSMFGCAKMGPETGKGTLGETRVQTRTPDTEQMRIMAV